MLGYIDTLPLFRFLYPNEKSHTQSKIFEIVIGGVFNAHNALDDVKALAQILRKLNIKSCTLLAHSFTAGSANTYYHYAREKKKREATLNHLVQAKVLSKGMASKAAQTGLCFEHFQVAFKRNGEEGIRALFVEENSGKPRVSKSNKVIKSVSTYSAGI